MDIQKCRAFVKVAEKKNITYAAREMGYSQPGISHMLDALEKEVGFPLLIRSKDKITPTAAGNELLYYCRQIIKNADQFQETVMSINGLLQGNINIGSYNSTLTDYVPDLISSFMKAYPQITMQVKEYAHSNMIQDLTNGVIDIGFMSEPCPNNFEFYPLFKDYFCVIISKDHPLAAYDKVPVKRLYGCNIIAPTYGWDDIIKVVMNVSGINSFNTPLMVSSDVGSIALASRGQGVYITSTLQTYSLPENAVYREFDEPLYRVIGICVRSLKHASPAAREFIRFAMSNADLLI